MHMDNNFRVPDHFNDDISLYYIDDISRMLDIGDLSNFSNDHSQALLADMDINNKSLGIHEKLSAIQVALKVPKSHYNKFSDFHYRSVDDIYEAVKPIAHNFCCVLTLSDEPVLIGERFYFKGTATLSDGKSAIVTHGYAREPESHKKMSEAQLSGSSSSFARKYALDGLLLLDNTQDIDSLDNSTSSATNAYQSAKTGDSTMRPPSEIQQIISMIDNHDLPAIVAEWSAMIGRNWEKLDPNLRTTLNKLYNQAQPPDNNKA